MTEGSDMENGKAALPLPTGSMQGEEKEEEEIICLDESFFVNSNYQLTTFTFGSNVLRLLCLQSASTDYDLTGQLILNKNIELQQSTETLNYVGLVAEKLEWGSPDDMNRILQRYPGGFDLVLGADICFQQSSVPPLFDTVEHFLRVRGEKCKFILAYVSRAKIMDAMVINEATKHGMEINEVNGTRSVVGNLEGVIFEISLC